MVKSINRHRKLFQDSIVVTIPIDVTADLGIAIKRTREKRIQAIYENFPSLRRELIGEDKDEILDSEDDEENKEERGEGKKAIADTKQKKERKSSRAPQRDHYGNILDYLEAKYVQGVMLLDDEDVEDENDEDEKRSVYSESSFLDDSLLKRDVAEQVLSQATHTKLELEQDDDSFFVNVGALEVEENDLMDYDPLEEDEKVVVKSAKRKRVASLDNASLATTTSTKPSTKKVSTAVKEDVPSKSGTTKGGTKGPAETVTKNPTVQITQAQQDQINALKKRAMDLKERADKILEETCATLRNMTDKELPRKKKNEKVSIVVPEGKSPGDDITFANPHVPGQKLRVKVPKNVVAGGKFVVSVPVPTKANPDVDNNKWSREAQDLLDDFSHVYDDWCHAEAAWREADPNATEKFQLHHERMNKFDKIIAVLPKDLVTPIDGTYLRKVVRRARQNKHKRIKTAQKLDEEGMASIPKSSSPAVIAPETETAKSTLEIGLPGKGKKFPRVHAPVEL